MFKWSILLYTIFLYSDYVELKIFALMLNSSYTYFISLFIVNSIHDYLKKYAHITELIIIDFKLFTNL